MKFEKEISGGFILLGTIYLIHPDRTFETVGHASAEGNDLLPRLIELGIPKNKVSNQNTSKQLFTNKNNIFVNNNQLGITNVISGTYSLTIFNLSGKEIHHIDDINLTNGLNLFDLDNNVSSGHYLVKLLSTHNQRSQKIIIK